MYNAVTFDTQTVRTNSFDFDGGSLKLLAQLRDHPTMFVVSEVVSSEILKHLSDHTQQVISSLESAMKRAKDFGVGEFELPANRSQARKIAQRRYKKFLADLPALPISASGVEVKDVLRLYFQNLPPFSNKKKAEFPDAIALLSLEAWAEKNDYRLLAISGDKDWAAFGKVSKRIDVVEDISAALDILNGQATDIRAKAGQVLKLIASDTSAELRKSFLDAVGQALKGQVVDSEADANGYLSVVGSLAEITLQSVEFENVDSFDLLAWDAETIVVSFEAELRIDARADFYFSVFDPTDEDNVSIGTSAKSVERDWSVQIYMAIVTTDGDYEIGTVGLLRAPNVVHFGEVEPDFGSNYEPWSGAESDANAWQVVDHFKKYERDTR